MKSIVLAAIVLISLSAQALTPWMRSEGRHHPGPGHPPPGYNNPPPHPGPGYPPPPPGHHNPPPNYNPPSPYPPPGGGYYGGQNVRCSATDNGWEEHFGGHPDCRACLMAHGNCTETCRADEFTARVEGQVFDPSSNTYRNQVFFGRGADRYRAEDEAQRQCNWARGYGCRTTALDNHPQVVSQRRCR